MRCHSNTAPLLTLTAFLRSTSAVLRGTRARQHIQADGEPAPVSAQTSEDLSAELGAEAVKLSEESPGIVVEKDPMFMRQLNERMSRFVEKKLAEHPNFEVDADRISDVVNGTLPEGFAQSIARNKRSFESKLGQRSAFKADRQAGNDKIQDIWTTDSKNVRDKRTPDVITSRSSEGFAQMTEKSWRVAVGAGEHRGDNSTGDDSSKAPAVEDFTFDMVKDEIWKAVKPMLDLLQTYGPPVSIITYASMVGLQILLGIIYAIVIMRYYPNMSTFQHRKPPQAAIDMARGGPVVPFLRCQVSPQICLCSFCAWGARAAHTFHSVRIMNYWLALIFMSTLPCCTQFLCTSCTELNKRLGGLEMNLCESCLCSTCCCCCMIAQEAQTLDMLMGVEVGLFGLERKLIYD
mmetsp:Transcript_42139/g.75403  ORF Transcript_42139/g.75403 Transcript_42139/m.75403 type:complete len:405 (-) Transcript_42139:248-1462(-)